MRLVSSPQNRFWLRKFGDGYLRRNPRTPHQLDKNYIVKYAISRSAMNNLFIGKLNKNMRILEIGCNFGGQLIVLQKMGFKNLFGIELNPKIVEFSKQKTKHLNIIQGDAIDIPFKDNYFDLVFTSGLLIHISPKNIKRVISEIHRCSRMYIWGFEYFAKEYTEVPYREYRDVLWKTDFVNLYLKTFKNLKVKKIKFFDYTNDANRDVMFLLQKT